MRIRSHPTLTGYRLAQGDARGLIAAAGGVHCWNSRGQENIGGGRPHDQRLGMLLSLRRSR